MASLGASGTFPAVVTLADGSLMATYRVGSNKDSADGTVEFRRSQDGGRTWDEPATPLNCNVNNTRGSISVAYITPLTDRHLIMAACWIDRETYPGQPLFNEHTEAFADACSVGRLTRHGKTLGTIPCLALLG